MLKKILTNNRTYIDVHSMTNNKINLILPAEHKHLGHIRQLGETHYIIYYLLAWINIEICVLSIATFLQEISY